MTTRDELANLIDEVAEHAHREGRICSPREVADAILAAGYHGPVRNERWEYAVRRGSIAYPNVFSTAAEALDWAKGFIARSTEAEIVRRLVGPWGAA